MGLQSQTPTKFFCIYRHALILAGISITLVISGHWRCNRQLWPLNAPHGPTPLGGVWGHAPPEKCEIYKFRNVISSVLGIRKRAVFVAFKNFSGCRCCWICFYQYFIFINSIFINITCILLLFSLMKFKRW